MMNRFLTILTLFTTFGLFSQRLIDVTSVHEISEYQNYTATNTDGISFFDFDEDGWDDLTYPMNNDSIIFYKNINGTFHKISSFILAEGIVRQMLWVDYDNNGSLDLFISYDQSELRLYKNDGNFNFTDESISAGIYPSVYNPYGFSFADFDHDNDLDLYLCSYDSDNATNKFYENQGDGTFLDKTIQFELDNNIQMSFMPVWFDYDNDQNIDLHIINDRDEGNDALYKNEGGSFIEIGDSLGLANPGQNPMTSSISDFDNDGFQDIFITDFGVSTTPSGAGPYNYKLFKNQSGQSFENVASDYNLEASIFGWGALWVDYNNDAYEDLYVATGNNFGVTAPTPSLFFRNEQGAYFTEINDSIVGDIITFSFCPVKGDLNNDGFYDIVVLNKDTLPNLLLNEGNSNNYIKITPIGIVSNRMAIGAQIRVYAGGITQLQTVFCGEQLFAQNSQHKIFGLGSTNIVDSVSIHFPSGLVVKRYLMPVNQTINIYEEEYVSVPFNIYQNTDPLILCPNDTLTVSLSGFDNYLWNTGSTDSSLMITTPGTYYYEAFNMMGDTLYRSEDLIVTTEEMPLFQELSEQISCDDDFSGAAMLQFANPQGINNINWSNGEMGFAIDSLESGNYTYSFTTENSCTYTGQILVTEMDNYYLEIQTSPFTDNFPGSLSIFTFGGTPPFTFVLDGDTIASDTTGLNPGSYQLVVSDYNDCIQVHTIVIENQSTVGIIASSNEFRIFINDKKAKLLSTQLNIESIAILSMNGSRIELIKPSDWTIKEHFIEFDFPYPSGMYMVALKSKQTILREKVYNP